MKVQRIKVCFYQKNERVEDFYFRTDIVHTAPGMKDFMTVYDGKRKYRLRLHYFYIYFKKSIV